MLNKKHFGAQDIAEICSYDKLIKEISTAFTADVTTPDRTIHQFTSNTKLMIMPAFHYKGMFGVKLISVYERNTEINHDTIQGIYCLFDSQTGAFKATFNASELTMRRTASASALASKYLSREDSATLVIAGSGKLIPYMISAHATVRPLTHVRLYGRNRKKIENLIQTYDNPKALKFEIYDSFAEAIKGADIISTATSAQNPILFGDWLEPGMHVDLVGAHNTSMQEADPKCFYRSKVVVDTYEGCLSEAGDLINALSTMTITKSHIQSDLSQLIKSHKKIRSKETDITLFKSVGTALEDLAAAIVGIENMFNKKTAPNLMVTKDQNIP